MHTTSRLGLDVVDGTDNVNNYPTADAQAKGILDFAAIYNEGTLAGRLAANAVGLARGTTYRTTDAGAETLAWTDGTVWLPLGLIPAIVTGNTPAVSGQAIITTGSGAITVTLPTPTSGAMVAVVNRTTNVTTVSGSNIQGAGLSSASSFPLGSAGASAILLADGTNWTFLAGQQDTGWVALTLGTNVNAGTGYVPSVRLVGDSVRCKGAPQTSNTIANGATIFTVPTAAKPGTVVTLNVLVGRGASSTLPYPVLISSASGAASAAFSGDAGLPSGAELPLDGESYSIN